MIKRRGFLKSATIASIGLLSSSQNLYSFKGLTSRKIKISLIPGTVGINVDAHELLDLAVRNNFDSIYPILNDLNKMSDQELTEYQNIMSENNISFDIAILPVDFSGSQNVYKNGLSILKEQCKIMSKINSKGFCRWIMPTSNDFTYLNNFKIHRDRLKECAKMIGENGMKLGLEFVGPKTLMSRDQFSFIRTINEMRELIDSINEKNVGYQLDTFHLYCANHDIDDIRFLKKEDIIMCQINDAVEGRSSDEQIDFERELPGKTGLIDTSPFLNFLNEIGYDGTVSAEPFNKELNNLNNEEAAKATYQALRESFDKAGV